MKNGRPPIRGGILYSIEYVERFRPMQTLSKLINGSWKVKLWKFFADCHKKFFKEKWHIKYLLKIAIKEIKKNVTRQSLIVGTP